MIAVDDVTGWVQEHRNELGIAASTRVEVEPYKRGFLSTMHRLRAGDRELLVAIKLYDAHAARTQREYEVLRCIGGAIAPRVHFVDTSAEILDGSVLVTDLLDERIPTNWTDDEVDRMASVMAEIHTDPQLMSLPVDVAASPRYSLASEFDEETSVLDRIDQASLRDPLVEAAENVRPLLDPWAEVIGEDVVVYIHGDLPHSHYHVAGDAPRIIHWEFSRRSHPSRELGRSRFHLGPAEADRLAAAYRRVSPFECSADAIAIQEALQFLYEAIHVAFWIDRAPSVPADRVERAHREAAMVRLYLSRWAEGRATSIIP